MGENEKIIFVQQIRRADRIVFVGLGRRDAQAWAAGTANALALEVQPERSERKENKILFISKLKTYFYF